MTTVYGSRIRAHIAVNFISWILSHLSLGRIYHATIKKNYQKKAKLNTLPLTDRLYSKDAIASQLQRIYFIVANHQKIFLKF